MFFQLRAPQELLELAEQTYKSTAGYTFTGVWQVLRPGASSPIPGDVTVAALPQALQAGKLQGPAVMSGIRPDSSLGAVSLMLPGEVFGGWDSLAENVLYVTEKSTEPLKQKAPSSGSPQRTEVGKRL